MGRGGGAAMGNPRQCLENARSEKDGTSAAPDRSTDKRCGPAGWGTLQAGPRRKRIDFDSGEIWRNRRDCRGAT